MSEIESASKNENRIRQGIKAFYLQISTKIFFPVLKIEQSISYILQSGYTV